MLIVDETVREIPGRSRFDLREQWAAAECEAFVCGERRDSEIKLAQRVLSRFRRVCHTVRAHVSHALMVVRYVAHAAIRETVTGRYCSIENLPVWCRCDVLRKCGQPELPK